MGWLKRATLPAAPGPVVTSGGNPSEPGGRSPGPISSGRLHWLHNEATTVWVVTLAFLAARLLAAASTNLLPDEAYYWLWSRHPSASYFDHPPMVAWWIWLSTKIFGDSTFGVRALSVFSTLAFSATTYLAGRILYCRAVVRDGVIWLNATLLAGIGGLIATPDEPSVLFWSLATLAVALLIRTGRPVWWLAIGLCAGLGVLSKLTGLFLGLGLVLTLALDRDIRRWVFSPWPRLGAWIAVATVLPMLLWNAGHHWVTFGKQFSRIPAGSFAPYYLVEFVVVQGLLLNPFVFVFVVRSAASWLRALPSAGNRATAVLFATVAPLIAYMTVHAFHGRVEGNWLAPIYPTLALVAADEARKSEAPRWERARLRLRSRILPFGAVCSAIGLLVFVAPDGLIPNAVDFARIVRGWPQVAAAADKIRQDTGAAWIATVSYGTNAELSYYLRNSDVPVVQVTDRVRYAFEPDPDVLQRGGPALVVADGTAPPVGLARCFDSVVRVGEVSRPDIQRFTLYLAEGPKPAILAGGC